MTDKEKLMTFMGKIKQRLYLTGCPFYHLFYTPKDAEKISKRDDFNATVDWLLIEFNALWLKREGFLWPRLIILDAEDVKQIQNWFPVWFCLDSSWHFFKHEWYKKVLEEIKGGKKWIGKKTK